MASMQRPAIVTMPLTIALFFGGGIGGVALATYVAPNSIIANFVGLMALPFAFLTGMQLWLGFALFSALGYCIRRLFGKLDKPPSFSKVPPGSYAFLLTSLGVSGGAGLIMATVATRLNFFTTLLVYLVVGLLYGLTCWLLARSGFLPFPEE